MTGSSLGMRTSFGVPEARPRKKKAKSREIILKFRKYCSRHESEERLIWQKNDSDFLFFWGNTKKNTHSR